jgi:hypothetical protein
LVEIKPPARRAYAPEGKAKILTADIHLVFQGLKLEPDTEIGQKGLFKKVSKEGI